MVSANLQSRLEKLEKASLPSAPEQVIMVVADGHSSGEISAFLLSHGVIDSPDHHIVVVQGKSPADQARSATKRPLRML